MRPALSGCLLQAASLRYTYSIGFVPYLKLKRFLQGTEGASYESLLVGGLQAGRREGVYKSLQAEGGVQLRVGGRVSTRHCRSREGDQLQAGRRKGEQLQVGRREGEYRSLQVEGGGAASSREEGG